MSFPRFPFLFLLLLAAFLSTSSVSAAQAAQLKIYTTRDGLAGDFITAITLAPDGSVWIGTSEGATHISDAGLISFTRAHGLGDSFITAIAVAPDGKIWFGTQGGGLSVLDPTAKTITTFNLDNSEIPSNFITALAIDSSNRVWIGTLSNGVSRYAVAENKWTRYELPTREITAIALDFDNAPWVGTPNGVFYFDGANWVQDKNVGNRNVRRIDAFDGEWYLTTEDTRFILQNDVWVANDGADAIANAFEQAKLTDGQITAFGKDYQQRYWLGTARGIFMAHRGNAPTFPPPLPVVLVHGWTVAGDDTLETSEFRFLKSYAERDGIPMYYARGVSPKNTLYQNAAVIRDEIARVKKETGADKVNVIAFSMGGMNTRAYLESSLYANDVNRAIFLGTPQAGVDIWKPILMQQILEKFDEPSALELSPEYAQMIVNNTRAPNPNVPYDLLIGDAREQAGLGFLQDMPASDALISVHSALALDAPNVRKHINGDLHDWGPEPLPIDLTSYLYPRATWERYLRNALRNKDNAPIGSEVASPSDESSRILLGIRGVRDDSSPTPLLKNLPANFLGEGSNHTPVVTKKIGAGETVTNTVLIDENKSARFVAYYPGGKIDFSLIAPDGKKFEPSDLPRADDSGALSLSTDVASFSGYVIKNAAVGEWQMLLTRTDHGSEPLQISTYAELDAPHTLNAFTRWQTINVSATNTITGSVRVDSGETDRDVKMTARVAQPAQTLDAPFTFTELELFDDGKHNDGAANDGYFANDYTSTRAGWHLVFVQANAKNFARESESLFAVSPNDARIARDSTLTREQDQLRFNGQLQVERAGDYVLSAQLRDAATLELVASNTFPKVLKGGTNSFAIAYDVSRLASTTYVFTLTLLDTKWAAFDLDRANFTVPTPLP